MKVIDFGSMNLDYVYHVDHFVLPGETLGVSVQHINAGGKGLNQAIALARAGASVFMAGCVGEGGESLVRLLEEDQIDTSLVRPVEELQGNALIQVDPKGENAILLYAGSNACITPDQVEETLALAEPGDYLVLQNEISCLKEILEKAPEKGLEVVLNPSPYEDGLKELNLGAARWLLVNEIEAKSLSGEEDPEKAWQSIHAAYPKTHVVLTLGSRGAWCFTPEEQFFQPAIPVKAVDTTGAGDTFTGFFLASLMQGLPLKECMYRAACASSIEVTRPGAAPAIPTMREVEAFMLSANT